MALTKLYGKFLLIYINNNERNNAINIGNYMEGIDYIQKNPQYILIGNSRILELLRKSFAQERLLLGSELLGIDILAYAFQKNSPLLKPFSEQ